MLRARSFSQTQATTEYSGADGTSNGWIGSRLLVFNTQYADSTVRLLYSDNNLCYGDYRECRYMLKVDGNDCPNGPIGGSWYTHPGGRSAVHRFLLLALVFTFLFLCVVSFSLYRVPVSALHHHWLLRPPPW
jgi:hypothetical protein